MPRKRLSQIWIWQTVLNVFEPMYTLMGLTIKRSKKGSTGARELRRREGLDNSKCRMWRFRWSSSCRWQNPGWGPQPEVGGVSSRKSRKQRKLRNHEVSEWLTQIDEPGSSYWLVRHYLVKGGWRSLQIPFNSGQGKDAYASWSSFPLCGAENSSPLELAEEEMHQSNVAASRARQWCSS